MSELDSDENPIIYAARHIALYWRYYLISNLIVLVSFITFFAVNYTETTEATQATQYKKIISFLVFSELNWLETHQLVKGYIYSREQISQTFEMHKATQSSPNDPFEKIDSFKKSVNLILINSSRVITLEVTSSSILLAEKIAANLLSNLEKHIHEKIANISKVRPVKIITLTDNEAKEQAVLNKRESLSLRLIKIFLTSLILGTTLCLIIISFSKMVTLIREDFKG